MIDWTQMVLLLTGGASGGIIVAFIQYLQTRPKNKAEAELTLGEGWEQFAKNLKQEIIDIKKDKEDLWKQLLNVNAAYFEQQKTIAEQTRRIADQEQEIQLLKHELEKYKNPVIMTPVQ